ncbi:hypothetical protein JYU23_01035, partial [bacterium AH-315-C07]|nr:hypothetical protein [bacterium AH-315-C07]
MMRSKTGICGVALILIFIGVFNQKAYSSHAIGADISYECIDSVSRSYRVTVNFYRDCDGISAPSSVSITPTSSCGNASSFTLNLVSGSPSIIDPTCASVSTTCDGGSYKGVEENVYQGIVTLPSSCSDWVFAFSTCCRNGDINTLANPSSEGFYVSATLDNSAAPCNSAPTFSNPPVPFVCAGQSYIFNNGAYDPDGDSLVYSLIAPMSNASNPVAYTGAYSASNPLDATPGVSVDPVTGDITFTANSAHTGVLAILVEEYRNGVLIGSVVRDIQITVLSCTNNIPTLSGINGGSSYDTIIVACGTKCFTITPFDADGNNITMQGQFSGVPGGSFTVTGQGTPSPVGTFCISPDRDDTSSTPYLLTITVADDNCPIIGQQTYSYAFYAIAAPAPPVLTASDTVICLGECVTITASGSVDSYLWNTGETGSSIFTCPGATSTFTLQSTSGSCFSEQYREIVVNGVPTANINPDNVDLCNGASTTLVGSGGGTYKWSTTETTSSVTVAPASTTIYSVEVTSASGCKDTAYSTATVNPPPAGAYCNIIFVKPGAGPFGTGTRADPADLLTGLALAECNNSTIKMQQGTYTISSSIIITNNTTLEGGYDPTDWDIKSNTAPTIIYRDNSNPQSSPARLIAFELNTVSNFRLRDLTIQVQDATSQSAVSTYGVHLLNCSNYDIVRCTIIAGNGGSGVNGTTGTVGLNGSNGGAGSGGINGCTSGSAEGNSGAGGSGGGAGGGGGGNGWIYNCGSVGVGVGGSNGTGSRDGGGGGSGGTGGYDDVDAANGGTGGNGGGGASGAGSVGIGGDADCGHTAGQDGTSGSGGAGGAGGLGGAGGSAGSHIGGFWVPGGQGGTATDGQGGGGGSGGGG